MDRDKLLTSLITMLTAEGASTLARTGGLARTWESFGALVNVRPPLPASTEFLRLQDELLQGKHNARMWQTRQPCPSARLIHGSAYGAATLRR